ncbi:glycerophosphodiester phosphodiesterase family protein [Chryseolinea lacunae]|uniref:Glycerophosphodiester phosphodiesterase family protein n=1 Tax=Chryseolinea lacunae TaxID=2801331 RepID=A0ABS1KYH6_9BACT|nr:glycerophosphodiester phosphodiesterase family protein [Chryseolinea lacunae]MBL0743391.1 glycerophosphodiester phosphodiesterase family protein [Chryseolinea lacunae]
MKRNLLLFMLTLFSLHAMAQWKTDTRKLWICGHRGGFYDAFAENSLPLFKHTESQSKLKPVVLELDIRKSESGKLYILHDETVDRTTTGTGKIAALTDTYLASLFLKDAKGNITNQRLLTFDDFLTYAAQANIVMMLDIKTDVWVEAIAAVSKASLLDKTIVLTFKIENTKKVYDASQQVLISCLVRDEKDWLAIEALSIPTKNLVAYTTDTTPAALVTKLRALHVPNMKDVSEFTKHKGALLTPDFYRNYVEKSYIDILITDYPIEVSSVF